MLRRIPVGIAVIAAIALGWAGREAVAQACYPNFSYGSYAGYSFAQPALCAPAVPVCGPRWGGWCGPRWGGLGWCAPRASWGGGWGCRPWGWRSRWCAPAYGACGWPVYGWGGGWPAWYGTSWYSSYDSVSLSAPAGGTFFSGGLVPFPAIGGPVIVTGFSATSPRPRTQFAPAATAVASQPRQAVRASNATSRLRAARLVAIGDRHLREADGDPAAIRRAADAYRRAAAVAADQPDTFIRQAIALVALGDGRQADAALARAVALDGRLADTRVARAGAAPDPVFGDRPAGSLPPIVARGVALVRQIAGQATAAENGPDTGWLADRWATRFGGEARAVAATAPRVR